MLSRLIFVTAAACALWSENAFSENTLALDASIPIVDMNDYFNPETRQKFIDDVAAASHEIGFFGVVNTRINDAIMERALAANIEFFNSPSDLKMQLCAPLLNGQRGYVISEVAQEGNYRDWKEFLHIGDKNNIWPEWMDLETPTMEMVDDVKKPSEIIQKAFALALGEEEDFFINMTREGESLLRPLHYPPIPVADIAWALKHTDIDLFTIIPLTTEDGLQVWHNDHWISVKVPPNAFIVNCGDFLQNISNGYFKSAVHQVIAPGANIERYSIVYFIHTRNDDPLGPRPKSIAMTGGKAKFPTATRMELLAIRLREINLASPELKAFEESSGIMERIEALVESGDAADPIKLTYSLRNKGK